ncbi:FAD-dependent oxidoreductase [Enterovibrio norvegicus FF-33]|uniref:NAD(P)/FAD-dependent oxidoreductase n=1 Tax=Enterovibrio norvegicus TaxID=188144 RepID=UPI0002E604D7|nr:FAD-binding oxidoreductase [Enterovibrio norvegicus]OEE67917.1 FAD-dependent oxidoreductase [Enterovibrio norvegicus FF-33]
MASTSSKLAHTQSYYAATAKYPQRYPELTESITADICIVGGGFSGVNSAIELALRGYSVVVLEANKIGWGASGRNGGELIRGIGHGIEQFTNQIGKDGVEAINQMGVEAVEIVKDRVGAFNIDCDLTMGYCDLALKPAHMKELEDDFNGLKQSGYAHEIRMLDKEAMPEVIGSERYIGGMLDMGSGHLHPLNLVTGEAAAAASLGVQMFEDSAAIEIIKGNRPLVKTNKGQVTCQYLLLAGNAYIGNKLESYIGGKVLPAGSYIVATEPLTDEQVQSTIPKNMAFADLSIALDYYHLSGDNRLLFGGLCTYSGKDPKDITGALLPNLERVFPQLKGTNIDFEWGGMIGIGANRLPQIGRLPDAPNIFYAQAYSGHGVNATHMAGKVIAEAISGTAERFDVFARVKHMTFPGGPILRSPLLAIGMTYHKIKEILQ